MRRLALAEFGFEHERALGDDDGTRFQSIDDLDPATATLAGDNCRRLKTPCGFYEHDFLAFNGLHRFLGQRDQSAIAAATRLDAGAQALTGGEAADPLRRQYDG